MGRQKTVADGNKELQQAIRRLKPDQGHVARRNARKAVWAALASIRRCAERDFPSTTPRKVVRRSRRPADMLARFRAKMRKQNRTDAWRPGEAYRDLLLRAGIKPKYEPGGEAIRHKEWWPRWCQALRSVAVAGITGSKIEGFSIAKLRKIKRSTVEQQIILAKWRLGEKESNESPF